MSQLNQIIASLLSDINEAKSKADEASRNLAQTYASDDILRYFPVPKIGIQNLEIELKYAIEAVEEKPIKSSQSQQRLAALLDSFSSQLAKEIKAEVAKVTQTNELFRKLGTEYPSTSWEENLSSLIRESFTKLNGLEEDPAKSLKLAGETISKSYSDFFPVVYKSESIGIIPVESGNYQIVGLDAIGKVDFTVDKSYSSDNEALADAKTLTTAITTKKIEVVEAKREVGTKMDVAKLKAGNQEFSVVAESQKVGSIQPKVFFENTFKEKNIVLNTPIRTVPTWVSGRPALATSGAVNRPASNTSAALKEDFTLKLISDSVIRKKLPELESAITKLVNETKVTTLQVSVEADKLKQLKPENMATIKFTLNGNDFTLLDEDGQRTII